MCDLYSYRHDQVEPNNNSVDTKSKIETEDDRTIKMNNQPNLKVTLYYPNY